MVQHSLDLPLTRTYYFAKNDTYFQSGISPEVPLQINSADP